jgi:hypothetical protein
MVFMMSKAQHKNAKYKVYKVAGSVTGTRYTIDERVLKDQLNRAATDLYDMEKPLEEKMKTMTAALILLNILDVISVPPINGVINGNKSYDDNGLLVWDCIRELRDKKTLAGATKEKALMAMKCRIQGIQRSVDEMQKAVDLVESLKTAMLDEKNGICKELMHSVNSKTWFMDRQGPAPSYDGKRALETARRYVASSSYGHENCKQAKETATLALGTLDAWIDRNRIVGLCGHSSWWNLLPRKFLNLSGEISDDGWFHDHTALFYDADGNRVYTTQPYGRFTKEDVEKVSQWAEERGLTATYEKESWHLPGSTVLITLRIADAAKYDEYLRGKPTIKW